MLFVLDDTLQTCNNAWNQSCVVCLDRLPGLKVSVLWCTSRNVYILTGVFLKETDLKNKGQMQICKKYSAWKGDVRTSADGREMEHGCGTSGPFTWRASECGSYMKATSFSASTLWSSQQSAGWGGDAMSHTDAAFSGFWSTDVYTDKSTVLCVLDWTLSLTEYKVHYNFRTHVLMWSKIYLLVSLPSIHK